MTARHQVSRSALELIMRFEGYRRKAARLSDGRWTIGYGHTLSAREGAEVSQADAEALLFYDVRPVAAAVNELVYTPLTQNQFDALVAFAYNVGVDNFRRSAALRRVNEGAMIQAACALEMWRKADFEGERIVVDALVRRRAAEKTLFLTPSDGWVPVPSPILRPRVDYDVGQSMPKSSFELESPMTGDLAEAHRAPAAPPETSPASLAVADAVSARLHEILPETAEVPPQVSEMPAEPDFAPEPVIDYPPMAETANEPPFLIAPEPEPVVEPVPTQPLVHEAELAPAYLTAPALFGVLFGRAPTVFAPAPPVVEPAAAESPTPQTIVPDAGQPVEAEPAHDPRFDIPEREPADLSRRVVWREAPMETDTNRLLSAGLGGLSPLVLLGVFLAGLAVFAGAIVWGMNTHGSGLAAWLLGLIGIVLVVSSVYIYLERLGHEE